MKITLCAFVVAIAIGLATSSPVDVTTILNFISQTENVKIPKSLRDELQSENVPAEINVKRPANFKGLQLSTALSVVDPNTVVDTILKQVDDTVDSSGVDPYVLASFDFLGLVIDLEIGSFDTLHRASGTDATMTIYDTNNAEFYSDVQVYSLYGDFAFSFTFIGITYNAGANAVVDTVDADVDFTVSVNPANNATYIECKSLESSNIGRISVEVYGLGPLDPFANVIANIFLNLFSFVIPWFFDGIFLDIVNQILNELYPPWQ